MKDIQGIIFDLDGVLCHTDHYHYLAWKAMCDQYGLDFDQELNHQLRGVSRSESLSIILRHNKASYRDQERQKMTELKNDKYRDLLMTLTEADASKDVLDTLKALRDRGYHLAIGSSSKNAKLILSKLQMTDYFEAISDGTNITHSKPDPEVFVKAAKMLGLEHDQCMVIEDAEAGIDAAVAGGFSNAGIGQVIAYDKVENKMNKLSDLLIIL